MKKRTTLVCVLALGLSLSACGNNSGKESTETTTSQQTQESSSVQESQSDTQGSQDTASGTENAPQDQTGWSKEMEALKKVVTDALGENYWPNYQLSAEMLENTTGITEDLYDDYLAEMPMISTNVDTLIMIKAKPDKVEALEDALEAYRDKLVNDTMQYPMNLGKIQASRIEVIDSLVCFVQLGADTTQALDQGEEAVIEQCQEQNEMVLEVIRKETIQ